MADFCCYHSSEEVVSLGVGESFFLNTGPKNGASSAPNWDVLGLQARVGLPAPKHSPVN